MTEELSAPAIIELADGWKSQLQQVEQTESVIKLGQRAEDLSEKARLAEIHELDDLLAQLRKVADRLAEKIELALE